MSEIPKLLDELSYLSRETVGGSFVIQHSKETGLWKVVFNNCMVTLRNDPIKESVEFEEALKRGIEWIRNRRKLIETPTERYTLY